MAVEGQQGVAVLDPRGYQPAIQKEVVEIAKHYWGEIIQGQIADAIELPFQLTAQQADLVNKYVAPAIVRSGKCSEGAVAGRLIKPSHAAQRALAHVAATALKARVAHLTSNQYLEIGIAPARAVGAHHHACSKVDARDQSRIACALVQRPAAQKLMDAYHGVPRVDWCYGGFENCDHPALVGIAVDSIYDITPDQLRRGFRRHNMLVLYATAWVPDELSVGDGEHRTELYHLSVHGDEAVMSFHDEAYAYCHSLRNWRDITSSAALAGPGFSILCETVQSWGPVKLLRYTRVNVPGEVVRPLPAARGIVHVPNFTAICEGLVKLTKKRGIFQSVHAQKVWARERALELIRAAPVIVVPVQLWSHVMQFINNRKDSDVERNVIGSAITARCSRMEVAEYILQTGHPITGADHRDLSISAMLIGCAGRMMQSQIISTELQVFGKKRGVHSWLEGLLALFHFEDRSLTEFARLMGDNGYLVEVVANCVNERPAVALSRCRVAAGWAGGRAADLTSIGGRYQRSGDGCHVGGADWVQGAYGCAHGVSYVNHVEVVDVAVVAIPDVSVRFDNVAKSAAIADEIDEPVFAVCGAPLNDGARCFIGYNLLLANDNEEPLPVASMPNKPHTVGGNANCAQCLRAMAGDTGAVYADYGSSCRRNFANPRAFLGRKAVVKVQRGAELLATGSFPAGYEGWWVLDCPRAGSEVVVSNFQPGSALGRIRPRAVRDPAPRGRPRSAQRASAASFPIRGLPAAHQPLVVLEEWRPGTFRIDTCGIEAGRPLVPMTIARQPGGPLSAPFAAQMAFRDGPVAFSPVAGHDCFISALYRRNATRAEEPLASWGRCGLPTEIRESFEDLNSHAFVGPQLFGYVARKLRVTIEIHDASTRTVMRYGMGPCVPLLLRDEHFSALALACRECEKLQRFVCTDCRAPVFAVADFPGERMSPLQLDKVRREMLVEEKYREVHSRVLERVSGFLPARKVHYLFGVAGSGKTTWAVTQLPEGTIAVSPTRALAEELNKKHRIKAFVWSQFCARLPDAPAVLIDEVFMQHPVVLECAFNRYAQVFIIGDPSQRSYGGADTARVYVGTTQFMEGLPVALRCSRAVPLDVCGALEKFDVHIKTHNRATRSICATVGEPVPGPHLLVFGRKAERQFGAATVAKSQGSRYGEGALFLDAGFDHAKTARPARDMYVALTRHTKRLQLYLRHQSQQAAFAGWHTCLAGGVVRPGAFGPGEVEQHAVATGERFSSTAYRVPRNPELSLPCATTKEQLRHPKELSVVVPMDFVINNNVFGSEVLPGCNPLDPEPIAQWEHHDQLIHSYCGNLAPSVADAEAVLGDLSPANSAAFSGQRHLTFQFLGSNQSMKRFQFTTAPELRAPRSGGLITAARLRGRECRANDYSQTLQTMLGRYSKRVALLRGREAEEAGQKLFEGLRKVLVKPVRCIQLDLLDNARASQIARIADKKEDQCEGVFGTAHHNTTKISFFLKQQIKSDLKPNSHLRGDDGGGFYNLKPGQGISAQPKTINHIVGAYVSAAERVVRDSLDPRVLLGYGYSKPHFRELVRDRMRMNQRGDQVVCCDISEQDTSKGPWTNHFMRLLYRLCGVPDQIIDLIECANIDWEIDAREAKLKVKHKYQSGRADTLFANTMMNIGLIMSNTDIVDLRLALFQGDDSYVRAASVSFVDQHENLKVATGPIGDFVGYVVGERDIYLDLPRFCVKLLNRAFLTDAEVSEYRHAVYDWLSIYLDDQQMHEGFVINAALYNTQPERIALLFAFMRSFYKGDVFRVSRTFKNPAGVFELITEKVITRASHKDPIQHGGEFGN